MKFLTPPPSSVDYGVIFNPHYIVEVVVWEVIVGKMSFMKNKWAWAYGVRLTTGRYVEYGRYADKGVADSNKKHLAAGLAGEC